MYYDNITNEELQYFHGLLVPNFTIKLSDVLHKTSNVFDNKLFKIEEIISDKLYRIYPLFYTGKITSSNPNDKIIDDKVIIANKTTGTTYLTFISDETQEIQDYSPYGTYYSIGDTLTTAQYNSIISLLRRNTIHNDTFRIDDTITGTYGKYEFDIDDVTFLDTGILITQDTITAEPKVKLTDNVFSNSTYLLKLSVLHYSDVNILDDVTSDFKVIETVEVELTPNEWVDIPVNSLDYGYIILYDAEVVITHTNPIIDGVWVDSILLESDATELSIDESATITATVTDHNDTPISSKAVKFYDGSTLLDTVNTDSTGVATYTFSSSTGGTHTITAVADGYTSNSVELTVGGTTVTLTTSTNTITVGSSVTLTATVTSDGSPVASESVKFYDGETLIATETTDNNGQATYTYTPASVGTCSLTAVYDTSYVSSTSTVTVNKHTSSITASTSSNSIYTTGSVTLSGTIKIDNIGTASLSVKIYDGSTLVDTVTSGSGGAYTKTLSGLTHGVHKLKAVYEGSSTRESATSTEYSVTVSKTPTTLTINVPQLVYSDAFSITGVLKDNNNVKLYNATVKLYMLTGGNTTLEATGTTDSNGEVTFVRTAPTSITSYKFWLTYEGDATYSNVNSSEETRTVGKETSVLSVTSPSNNASYTYPASVSVAGTLLSNDGEAMSGKSIVISENGTTITTLTTDSNGAFSGTLTGLSSGSHTLTFSFATDTYYTASSLNRSISLTSITPSSIALTSNKSVLSYYDSESATLTATVTGSDNNPMSGQTVSIKVYDSTGTTLKETLTVTDVGDGTYTASYSSKGAGDLSIKAECMNLQETYVLEDCYYANTGTTSTLTIDTGVSCTIEDGAIKITKSTSGEKFVTCNYDYYNSNQEITFTVPVINSSTNVPLGFAVYRSDGTQIYWAGYSKSGGKFDSKGGSKTTTFSAGDTIRIVKSGSTLTAYKGTTTISSVSTATSGIRLAFYTNNNYIQYIDDIKVKPLS